MPTAMSANAAPAWHCRNHPRLSTAHTYLKCAHTMSRAGDIFLLGGMGFGGSGARAMAAFKCEMAARLHLLLILYSACR